MVNTIYIPGFGDTMPNGQAALIKMWRLFGVKASYSPVKWNAQEAYEAKLTKLAKQVDELARDGQKINLVGVSAGASMAMNLYTARRNKIDRVIFISGKLLYPETVPETYFQKNPAFKQSVFEADANFQRLKPPDKSKMLSLYGLIDQTVPSKASKLPGVLDKKILAIGHLPSIYSAIIFYAPTICRFLNQANH